MTAVPFEYIVAVVTFAVFGGTCLTIGYLWGRNDRPVEVDAGAVEADRVLREQAESYAAALEHDDVWLRAQNRGLRRQLVDAGVQPWFDEDDTPPPLARREVQAGNGRL